MKRSFLSHQKQRSTVCERTLSRATAPVRRLVMPEQLASGELANDRRAVQRNQFVTIRALTDRPLIEQMQDSCEQFLAGPPPSVGLALAESRGFTSAA